MALRLSVKARVTAWFTALMLLVTAAALGFIVALGGTMLEGIAKANLSRAVQVNAGAVEYYRDERSEKFELDDDFSPNIFGSRCAVYTGEGRLLTGVMPDGLGAGEPFVAGPPRLVSGGGQRFYICDLPISGGALWVRGVTTAEEAEVFFSSMARLSFVILPVLVLIGAAGGYFIVRRAFRPIDRMIAAADAINEGSDLSARIGLPPKDDEIHRIAAAFDRMLARLEASFESEKQFASDASCNLYYFLAAMILAGADGIVKGLDPVALGYQSQDAKDELTFPLNLNAVLDGLEKDNEYLAPAFPPKLIELWTKAKRAEAEYVYNAPTPQEYELYF